MRCEPSEGAHTSLVAIPRSHRPLLPLTSVACLVALASALPACTAETQGLRRSSGSNQTGQDDGTNDDGQDDGTKPGGTTPAPTGTGTTTPPTTDPPKPATNTKGSGGPTGRNTLKSAGNLSYILDVPAAAPAKPRGLLVALHGSGASNYTSFVDMMSAVASKYDLIRVSVLAPNGQGWNEGGSAAQSNAADLLHRLVQDDLFKKYDIETTKVFFTGQSSGGGFLSTHFLPLHAKDYRGGAFMQCGAAPPAVTFAPDAATKAGLKLHFEITTGDTIWPTSFQNAVTAYTNAGMTLTKQDTKPGGHCAFDQQAVVQAHIDAMLPK